MIADEVTDESNKEQLSLVLRYLDHEQLLIREDLVGFTECDTGTSGNSLATKITTTLLSMGLDLSYLHGQAYDGASNMSRAINGAASLISKNYPLALYVHCASHCLNLAVVKSFQNTSIPNMMGVVEKVFFFFNVHPKRQLVAISNIQPQSSVHKLKDLCRTRWVQRIDAIEVFCNLHSSVVSCMENICSEGPSLWSRNALTDAGGLQLAITTTNFISALVITNQALHYL